MIYVALSHHVRAQLPVANQTVNVRSESNETVKQFEGPPENEERIVLCSKVG